MKKFVIAALALALAAPLPLHAQLAASNTGKALFYTRDVAAAYEYCILAGAGGGALDKDIESRILIETSGSSTTTSASTATSAPFLLPAVGDEITVTLSGVKTYREIITNADDDTITVDTAWDLGTTGVPFFWRDLTCGTAVTNGIISAAAYTTIIFDIQVLTLNGTSIDARVEGRNWGAGTGWTPVGTATYTAVGGGAITANRLGYDQYRLGIRVTGDTGVQSVTAKVKVIQ